MARPDLAVALQLVELAERDRGQDVGEVRLVARDGDVVERPVAAPHDAVVLDGAGDLVVVRRDHAALAGGDVLRGVEREAGGRRQTPDLAAAVGALDGVRRVLDDGESQLPQGIQVGSLAGEVDGEDRLGARADEPLHLGRIDVQVAHPNVGEHGPGAGVDDHVRRRRPGDRRRDHLVARPEAERHEREVQRGRSGRDREGVLRLRQLRKTALELRRPRPGRQPAGADRLGDRLDLLVTDRRRLEGEKGLAAGSEHAASVTVCGVGAARRRAAPAVRIRA